MEIVFSDDDLARVRVRTRLDAIAELMYASQPWRSAERLKLLGGWARRTMTELGPMGAPVIHDVRSNAFHFISGSCQEWHAGVMQEILPADPDFDDVVDEVVLQSPREWQSLIDHHRGRVGDPFDAGLAQGRHDARASIGDSLRQLLRASHDRPRGCLGRADSSQPERADDHADCLPIRLRDLG